MEKLRTCFFKQKLHTITFWKITGVQGNTMLSVCNKKDKKGDHCVILFADGAFGCSPKIPGGFLLVNQYFFVTFG